MSDIRQYLGKEPDEPITERDIKSLTVDEGYAGEESKRTIMDTILSNRPESQHVRKNITYRY
jgi:hypothetical protein